MTDVTPLERADQVRQALKELGPSPKWPTGAIDLVPFGSLILTPDEAETLRIGLTWAPRPHGREARLLLAGKGQT